MDFVFAHSNVFLDAFLTRPPTHLVCDEILDLGRDRKIKLYTSSSCLLTVMYFLKRDGLSHEYTITVISRLLSFVSLISPSEQTFKNALVSGFSDLEDAVQYFTAISIDKMDYFITSNVKDFKKALAQLPVLTPAAFIKSYNKK